MNLDFSVNVRHCNFIEGASVLLKADFDTNVKTKKKKLEGFYSSGCRVVSVLGNNRIKIRKDNGEELVVRTSQIRALTTV